MRNQEKHGLNDSEIVKIIFAINLKNQHFNEKKLNQAILRWLKKEVDTPMGFYSSSSWCSNKVFNIFSLIN